MAKVKVGSIVTCPHCGFSSSEIMPTTFCLIRYQCKNCHAILVPKEGDDCVFCSWGDTRCPAQQEGPPKDSSKFILEQKH